MVQLSKPKLHRLGFFYFVIKKNSKTVIKSIKNFKKKVVIKK